ncbi:hypothetical protein [Sphingobacterium tabacisoli]|uniref:Uncharacterized protein n=1 Tax=Sphingobacterium tabacisoli TaxID=2044855 RepID=A0ABW5L3X0_9SPHI|nr:hypothetical protein [Sphingobacterium tabacisoli]
MIAFVGQPQIALHQSTAIKIYFTSKPDPGSMVITSTNSELETEFDASTIEKELETEGANYFYEFQFDAGALGKVDFPVVEAQIAGKKYTSQPASIEVVEQLPVDSKAVRTILITDREQYFLGDTITLSLFEYSKFMQFSRFTPAALVKKGGPEAMIAVIDEGNVDYKVGIEGFKKTIDNHFHVASFDWNADYQGKTMSQLDGETYIKDLIFEIKLIPKSKGTVTIGKSSFDYKVYPYLNAFKEQLLGPEEILRERINVQSNSLDIKIQ